MITYMVINVNMAGGWRDPLVRFGAEMARSEGGVPPAALLDNENPLCPLRSVIPLAVMNDLFQWVRWMTGMG